MNPRLIAILIIEAMFIFIHSLLFRFLSEPIIVVTLNLMVSILNTVFLYKGVLLVEVALSFRSIPKDHSWVKYAPYVEIHDGHNYMKCSKCGMKIAYSESYREYIDVSKYFGDLSYYIKPHDVKSCHEIVMDNALS